MISIGYVTELYRRYAHDLKAVRRQQYWFHRRHDNALVRRLRKLRLRRYMLFPALDDLEAEVTYLLIRDKRPKVMLEISPNAGWSTTWILSALRDNGDGELWSYDLHDTSARFVPKALARGRWHLVQGDARDTTKTAPRFDYLFLDSDHRKEFAEWYVEALLPRARRGTVVSVHDVFHSGMPSEEGAVVQAWLEKQGLSYWTVASAVDQEVLNAVLDERARLGLDFVIHPLGSTNSMMFFEV